MATNRILVVDDDPGLRMTLHRILKANGYAPTAVATGKDALAAVEEEPPAVALIDLRLEDMSGLKVMREIKAHSPGTECIVLTGYASQPAAIEAVNLGAYGFVQKPYDVDLLLVTIRWAIEKQEAEQALREREAQFKRLSQEFQGLLDAIPDNLTLQSRDLRVLWANKGAADALGKEVSDLIGQPCYYLKNATCYAP